MTNDTNDTDRTKSTNLKLNSAEKIIATIEGLYASKTIHLAEEPQGERQGTVQPQKKQESEKLQDGKTAEKTDSTAAPLHSPVNPLKFRPFKTAMMGDSMAVACGVDNQSQGMMPRIAQGLANRRQQEVSWETHGKLGATMRRVRFREFNEITSTDFDLLYICAGSNDLMAQRSLVEWHDDLEDVISQAKKIAKNVVVLSPGQLYNSPSLGKKLRKAMLIASDRQTAESSIICKNAGVTFLDVTHVDVDATIPEFYGSDNFHPGVMGYQIIADYVSKNTPMN